MTFDSTIIYINQAVAVWNKQRKLLAETLLSDPKAEITREQITYFLGLKSDVFAGVIVDMSLIHDYGVFVYKPPIILRTLYKADRQSVINIVADLINYEKNFLSKGSPDFDQMRHVIYLKNIADWVAKRKGADLDIRRKIIAGDIE